MKHAAIRVADCGELARRCVAVGALMALAACQPIVRNHGYAPTDAQLEEILVGIDTRATVEDVVGPPSASGVLTDSAYFYVASRREQLGWLAPRVVDRQVVAISFAPDGVVSNVERFTLEDGRVVPLARRVTESSIRDTTFLRQLLGNIGRFDAEQILE